MGDVAFQHFHKVPERGLGGCQAASALAIVTSFCLLVLQVSYFPFLPLMHASGVLYYASVYLYIGA